MTQGRKQLNNDFKMNEVREMVQEFITKARNEVSHWLVIEYGVEVLNEEGADKWYATIIDGKLVPSVYHDKVKLTEDMKFERVMLEDVHPENESLLRDRPLPNNVYGFIRYVQPFLGDKAKYAINGAATFYSKVCLPGDVTWMLIISEAGYEITRNGVIVE